MSNNKIDKRFPITRYLSTDPTSSHNVAKGYNPGNFIRNITTNELFYTISDGVHIGISNEDVYKKVETYLNVEANIGLLSVPSISDTYNPVTNEITRNCKRIIVDWVVLIKSDPEADFLVVWISDGMSRPDNPGIIGLTTLIDKNGNSIPELSNQWGGGKAGTHYLTSTSYVWFFVEKDKYANLNEAKELLGDMTLTYMLATSVIEQAEGSKYELDLSKSVNFRIVNDNISGKEIILLNPDQSDNKIITVSILFEAIVASHIWMPYNIIWQNESAPVLEEGKKSIIMLSTYDKGLNWNGSVIGTWAL